VAFTIEENLRIVAYKGKSEVGKLKNAPGDLHYRGLKIYSLVAFCRVQIFPNVSKSLE